MRIKARTDGRDEGRCERVLGEPQQQARLANAAVADQQQLDELVVLLGIVRVRGGGHRGRVLLVLSLTIVYLRRALVRSLAAVVLPPACLSLALCVCACLCVCESSPGYFNTRNFSSRVNPRKTFSKLTGRRLQK